MNKYEREIIDRLARIEENLKDHIRRTELLEMELKPLKQHVHFMGGGLKGLGILSIVVGIVTAVGKYFL